MLDILSDGRSDCPHTPYTAGPDVSQTPFPAPHSAFTHADSALNPTATSSLCTHGHPGCMYYTDGSAMEVATDAGMAQVTGAAFVTYHPHDTTISEPYTPYYVRPSGPGVFNENYRAELVPIHAVLMHHAALTSSDDPPLAVHIYTDSLSSLQALANAIFRPHTTRRKLHSDLLNDIARLVLARSNSGLHTHFHKVKAHASVEGNEHADAAAKRAARLVGTSHRFDCLDYVEFSGYTSQTIHYLC